MAQRDAVEEYKRQAAERALEFVSSGMIVGLGTGTTAIYATRRLGKLLREGSLRDVVCVPTSRATAAAAEELGIPLVSDELAQSIDVSIDGADEVSSDLHLIKGGGGALLREKIVPEPSRRRAFLLDHSKLIPPLGHPNSAPV